MTVFTAARAIRRRNLLCWLFGHRYVRIGQIAPQAICHRCGRSW
jgi:hypothetical protein